MCQNFNKKVAQLQNTYQKLIPKSISKFPKNTKFWKKQKLRWNLTFLFLFYLTLESFNNNWWQKPKRALVSNYYKIINILKERLAQINTNSKKKNQMYILLSYLHDKKKTVFTIIFTNYYWRMCKGVFWTQPNICN